MNSDRLLENEPIVFMPDKGPIKQINPKDVPSPDEAVFEMMNPMPIFVKLKEDSSNKQDNPIDDPRNPALISEILGDVSYVNGRMCLKKHALVIINGCLQRFLTADSLSERDKEYMGFYTSVLLNYEPEYSATTLTIFYQILQGLLKSSVLRPEMKYILTSKGLKTQWETCDFKNYQNFKDFFSAFKNFIKASPLLNEITMGYLNIDVGELRNLLKRELTGRASAIISHEMKSNSSLKMLLLVKTIEWIQKLESYNLLFEYNIKNALKLSTDKMAIELVKHMYGKYKEMEDKQENYSGDEEQKIPEKVDNAKVNKQIEPKILEAKPNNANTLSMNPPLRDSSPQQKFVQKAATVQKQQPAVQPQQQPFTTKSLTQTTQQQQQPKPSEAKENDDADEGEEGDVSPSDAVKAFFNLEKSKVEEYRHSIMKNIRDFFTNAKFVIKKEEIEEARALRIVKLFAPRFKVKKTPAICKAYLDFCTFYELTPDEELVTKWEKATTKQKNKEPTQQLPQQQAQQQQQIKPPQEIKVLTETQPRKPKPDQHLKPIQSNILVSKAQSEAQKEANGSKKHSNQSEKKDAQKFDANLQKEPLFEQKKPEKVHINTEVKPSKGAEDPCQKFFRDVQGRFDIEFPDFKLLRFELGDLKSISLFETDLTLYISRVNLAVKKTEDEMAEDVRGFLLRNFENSINKEIQITPLNQKRVLKLSSESYGLSCAILLDLNNHIKDSLGKFRLLLLTQPRLKAAHANVLDYLNDKKLLRPDGMSSYMVLLMLIVACQMKFSGQRLLEGLKEKLNIDPKSTKATTQDILERFHQIYSNILEKEQTRLFYFTIGEGIMKPFPEELSIGESAFFIEDPFVPNLNACRNIKYNSEYSNRLIEALKNKIV